MPVGRIGFTQFAKWDAGRTPAAPAKMFGVDAEQLVRVIANGTWPERIAAIRSVPDQFPGREHSAVYAEVAKECYVPDLAPHFHIIPWQPRYLDRVSFIDAYRAASEATDKFSNAGPREVLAALRADPRSLRIFRLIIGYTPNELKETARAFADVSVNVDAIEDGGTVTGRVEETLPALAQLISDLVTGADGYDVSDELRERGFLGKTDKPDTQDGWESVSKFATEGVPYYELLYQRWYGGAFRQLQDAGGSLKGDLLEDATQNLFEQNGVPFVRTVPGTQATAGESFGVTVQPAPDFILHDNSAARGLLECKSASDGGTARDKAGRFGALRREAQRLGGIPVLAVLEGFGWRRVNDALGPVVRDCDGRVFTPATLGDLVEVDPVRDLIGLAT